MSTETSVTVTTGGTTYESAPTEKTARVGFQESGDHWLTQTGTSPRDSANPVTEMPWLLRTDAEESGIASSGFSIVDLGLIQEGWNAPFATRGDLARANPERLASLAERGLMSVRDILTGKITRHWRPTALGLAILKQNGVAKDD